LDVKGAFDRCWWLRIKNRLEAKGMVEDALQLLEDYLFQRFIKIVCQGESSSAREIFSSVPQGGKWSESRV
jgi:hypothetical protein